MLIYNVCPESLHMPTITVICIVVGFRLHTYVTRRKQGDHLTLLFDASN